ncbi:MULTISPECIES: arsenate reductase/protein-tyrosine-phosphatase family protein [Psychrilyobacter]|uniref:Phosphotyrosine protein phosphatase I domain-containing protein n=1 Tax=Psychrilyobacter piezotolerans TaxID=2293438 RepID=A0ABX9KFK8_9FUSO|nr:MULTISPECIES: hypothetical protein [Psychrilyobacter]MCS5420893.1 hypothetical protein [Psychrilyobacter sp. S5]NDI78546.1 hypothetical protein [Psychrilyobacter piezotolerans]RDE60447.1 hypothetical protein DV867_10685 [Psychrilyobacter sp. S5]REI40477.1 hypothetical protein DYH56_10685 [Psychrilyobacter piezotolerans]
MKIAFVCSGNSFKSLIGERFGNEFNDGTFEIYSAGTNPAEKVNEAGEKIMKSKGYSMEGYHPSSMDKLPEKVDVLVKMGCDIDCPIHLADKVVNFGLENVKDKKKCVEMIELKVKKLLEDLSQ